MLLQQLHSSTDPLPLLKAVVVPGILSGTELVPSEVLQDSQYPIPEPLLAELSMLFFPNADCWARTSMFCTAGVAGFRAGGLMMSPPEHLFL